MPVAHAIAPRYYANGGSTKLIDGSYAAIETFKGVQSVCRRKKNEDHSFLLYVITDGEENSSTIHNASQLSSLIGGLDDDWTVCIMVPNQLGVHNAKNFGFPAGNIEVWNVADDQAFETEVGHTLMQTYDLYSSNRSVGLKSSKSLFMDAKNLTKTDVKDALDKVKGTLYHVVKDGTIRDLVENFTGSAYVPGSTFYEISKPEKIQHYKEIVLIAKDNRKQRYSGKEARDLLNLPDHDAKIRPGDLGNWRVFVQSTSVNRKLISGTSIFVKE